MSDADALKKQFFTYADYKAWDLKPGERFELIHGIAYAMSAPNTSHQWILMNLSGEFYAFLKNKTCKSFAAPFDVRLFYEEDESDDTVVQPDLVVVCDPEKLGEEGCRGAPDLVVEILSPSNTVYEMERKLDLYREALVKEYWIVNPRKKLINIYSMKDGEYYLKDNPVENIIQTDILPGLKIPFSEIFPE